MSTFAVQARRIEILPHANADALELAKVDDYLCVVAKGSFQTGDMAYYIPEQAIVPAAIIEALGLEGRLAGKDANRVKAIRLRGVLSQGLLYAPEGADMTEGIDYAETLGISKWVPPIPTDLSGKAFSCGAIERFTEIENLKRFPDAFADGEPVLAHEKLHGSCSLFTWDPERGQMLVSSKGIAKQSLCLEDVRDDRGRSKNGYWRIAHQFRLAETLQHISEEHGGVKVSLFGETIGVQDLMYGLQKGQLDFWVFDMKIDGRFLDSDELDAVLPEHLTRVPLLYSGPFSSEAIWAAATGMETITGSEGHIREGVIVRPARERRDDRIGRLMLKAVSEDYLTRKGGTEFE